ncbi:hypothetical protein [Verrucomicrobium sp. GAS474]|uniref:hypothetical protein n=1 Tax=Verrucomicrobium sp. GAS474 TaxID=1882831 RepID=UPI000B88462D|nr:hypothetical protein [Verrucomicrobium sp. GAS474]
MVRFLGYPLVALALFAMAGGHWAVLQSVAWAGMVAERVEAKMSLRQAVAQTLDGEHPCEMCAKIVITKKQEKDDPAPGLLLVKAAKKAEAVSSLPSVVPPAFPSARLAWRTEALVGPLRTEAPPALPPRGLLS